MDERSLGQKMHKDFFDNCQKAIDSGFYMEAILMEYAAIESRMEVLMGVLGLPCNKFLDYNLRKGIQISHRLHCASVIRKQSAVFENTKLDYNYFDKLKNWVDKRNGYIHGLYKNELKYTSRINGVEKFAKDGLKNCKLLYNEVNRLKRLKKNHPERFVKLTLSVNCSSGKCNLYVENER